jgi:hypothetical protein
MLTRWFEDTVSALTYSLIREHGGPSFSPLHNRVVRFVVEQHVRTPDYLRLVLLLATCAFDLCAVVFAGRPFRRLPPERRRRPLVAFAGARIGAFRDLVRFYETLVVFGWTSMRHERRHA